MVRRSHRLWAHSEAQNGEVALFQQILHDAEPFRIQRFSAHKFPCASVPVRSIALIAFFAMQISVNPRSVPSFVLLGGFVRLLPIALSIPPQSGEDECESGWRLVRGERLVKFVQGQLASPSHVRCAP